MSVWQRKEVQAMSWGGGMRSRLGMAMAVLLITACSPDDAADTTTTLADTTTVAETPTTTTTLQATTTTAPATTTPVPSTTTTVPEFPEAGDLEHGGDTWAVYLGVADDFGDPSLSDVSALAASYGFFGGTTDINCDLGAAELIGIAPGGSEAVVGVYFDNEADANQFILAWEARGHTVEGVGMVQTYCLD